MAVSTAPRVRDDLAAAVDAPADQASPDASEASDERSAVATVVVALLAVTIPLATAWVVWAAPGATDDWTRSVAFAPFDVVLVAALVWAVRTPRVLRDLFRSPAVAWSTVAFVVAFGVSAVVHPSWLGLNLFLRLLGGLAVIAAVSVAAARPATRRVLLGTITGVGVAQAVLAMVQSARGSAFGIEYLDFAGPLYPFGSSFAGRGGLTHPYHLAVLLAVAQGAALLGVRQAAGRNRLPWLVALAVLSAGIGVTYTRAGALGQVALVAALLVGRRDRRSLQLAAVAVVVGLGIGGLAFGDGWMARTEQTTSSADADSDRSKRAEEALELFGDHPTVGVGPGRYVTALAETDRVEYLPAHNLILHELAEVGGLGGLAVGALLFLLACRVLRGGAWTAALVLPVVPFLLLDAYPYVFATGLALSAIWLGLVRSSLDPPDAPDGADAAVPEPSAAVAS